MAGGGKAMLGMRQAGRWLGVMLDLVLPPRCPGCGAIVVEQGRFCAACWNQLEFIAPPWCDGCNHPFAHDRGAGARCAACLAQPPLTAGVRAAVRYGDMAGRLALRLKYGGRIGDAEVAARLMLRHLPADATLLVPVPLHRWRLWRRGYNQAGLIATALSLRGGVRVAHDLLERHRATMPLRDQSPAARRRIVRGAFRLRAGAAGRLAGAQVVLVDDVHTTGATAEACAAALLAGGARSVTVLAWARALRDGVGD